MRTIWRLRYRGWTYISLLFFLDSFLGNRFTFTRRMLDESDLLHFFLRLISIRDYNHFIKRHSILFVSLSNYFIMLFWGSSWNNSLFMLHIVLCKQFFELSCSLLRLHQATVEWIFIMSDLSFPRCLFTRVLNSHYLFLLRFILSTFIILIIVSPPFWIYEWVQWSSSFIKLLKHLLVKDTIRGFRPVPLKVGHNWDPPASWGLPIFLNYKLFMQILSYTLVRRWVQADFELLCYRRRFVSAATGRLFFFLAFLLRASCQLKVL